MIEDVRPLSEAGRAHISFIDNKKYLPQLDGTAAGACLVSPPLASRVPAGTAGLVTRQPYHGFARALALFYPSAVHPMVSTPRAAPVDPTAHLEDGTLEPVLEKFSPAQESFFIYYPRASRNPPKLRAFVEVCTRRT